MESQESSSNEHYHSQRYRSLHFSGSSYIDMCCFPLESIPPCRRPHSPVRLSYIGFRRQIFSYAAPEMLMSRDVLWGGWRDEGWNCVYTLFMWHFYLYICSHRVHPLNHIFFESYLRWIFLVSRRITLSSLKPTTQKKCRDQSEKRWCRAAEEE